MDGKFILLLHFLHYEGVSLFINGLVESLVDLECLVDRTVSLGRTHGPTSLRIVRRVRSFENISRLVE